ncbi:MAG: hypothetical protein HYS02_02190 [Candidatus Staskawiczbacteria bacterium]|nr:hypothetical protein [Candidatus Staskawiczbacteria bacterium]
MVVTAVISLVAGAAVVIFISVVSHQRTILSEQELFNQMSYVLEHMSKSLRVAKKDLTGGCLETIGYNYLLTRSDPATGLYKGIKFINQSDDDACQEFYLDNEDPNNLVLKELKNSINDSQAVAITSDKFKINSIRFGINGYDGSTNGPVGAAGGDCIPPNCIQPRVTIFLEVQTKAGNNPSVKKIQTTVSQRDLNVP